MQARFEVLTKYVRTMFYKLRVRRSSDKNEEGGGLTTKTNRNYGSGEARTTTLP